MYVYSKDKKINQVLNQIGLHDSRVIQNLGQVQGFSQNNNTSLTSGVFSSPQGVQAQASYHDAAQLTEEEL